jgi:hypothetical protein
LCFAKDEKYLLIGTMQCFNVCKQINVNIVVGYLNNVVGDVNNVVGNVNYVVGNVNNVVM